MGRNDGRVQFACLFGCLLSVVACYYVLQKATNHSHIHTSFLERKHSPHGEKAANISSESLPVLDQCEPGEAKILNASSEECSSVCGQEEVCTGLVFHRAEHSADDVTAEPCCLVKISSLQKLGKDSWQQGTAESLLPEVSGQE